MGDEAEAQSNETFETDGMPCGFRDFMMPRFRRPPMPVTSTDWERRGAQDDRRAKNKAAPMGATITCATCKKKIVKKHPSQAFCGPVKIGKRRVSKCKDRYHNTRQL